MDFSRFKTSDWLKVGGGALMLIGYFMKWWKAAGTDVGVSGSEWFLTGTLPWLLIVAVGVITFLLAGGIMKPGKQTWPVVLVLFAALGTLLVLIRFLSDGIEGPFETSRGIGLWMALLGALGALAGAFLGFKESGGDLNDLTDVGKLRSSFGIDNRGDGTPPPPPPPPPN